MSAILMDEVAAVLRRALRGEVAITLSDAARPWVQNWGDVTFCIDGWRITFFNDCDSLDYTDSAEAPDGRTTEFDEWCEEAKSKNPDWVTSCPLNRLTRDEQTQLERMLEACKCIVEEEIE